MGGKAKNKNLLWRDEIPLVVEAVLFIIAPSKGKGFFFYILSYWAFIETVAQS